MKTFPIVPARACGDCKACCEGWLSGQIYEHSMYLGKPCHYICETGCSIYENRPEEPCKNYSCMWLKNTEVPGWMKPNKSGVILSLKNINGIEYISAVEASDEKLNPSVLSWLFLKYVKENVNIYYQIKGIGHWIGSSEFVNAMNEQPK